MDPGIDIVMKKLLSGIFLSLVSMVNAHAESSAGNDIFSGMLVQDRDDIVFVRCDRPSLKMKIVETDDVNKKNVEAAYQTFKENKDKPLYFTFVGHVKNDDKGAYTFYLTDVTDTKLGSSCNLSDSLDELLG
ncbi:hypothetical protein D8682_02905 [Buttiauxella sp. 3AFRM03]|jgi:hypothetical protein|nr:hypothetical protein D8682_02905 [Buttiauxella sp. 3AFRM03]TDN54271.1 hypothetical protein EC843_101312 [Buttiauxella sp. JUb87]